MRYDPIERDSVTFPQPCGELSRPLDRGALAGGFTKLTDFNRYAGPVPRAIVIRVFSLGIERQRLNRLAIVQKQGVMP